MISAKRAQLAKKWQRMAALGRKSLTMTAKEDEECCTSVAGKGHCVMYTADGIRFEVPLAYLSTAVFSELLRMSQEEFGFSSDERIMLPCDAAVMEYAMCLLKRNASVEVEKALLRSMVKNKTTTSKPAMISAKTLVQLAKKWQKTATLGRKRIMAMAQETEECSPSAAVRVHCHCVMYTADGKRFVVPLAYLRTTVFTELLRMSQEEFGFSNDGRIVLPCDDAEMEYAIAMCLLKRNASVEMVNALLSSMLTSCHYTSSMLSTVRASQHIY
ncbi:hypothetical protein GUJ93_ZPchr0002g25128 [Zizania palustris]|uniref:Uncharacterized protein n=1 Tax=Zizania palustris TaxID=103762 RepID=A0A8J5VAF6_ZIZPA|nr:hypothetical protein GUJ93_ZPchr0002g25128 [Zizania palustris]